MILFIIKILRKIYLDEILKALLYSDGNMLANRESLLADKESYLDEREMLLEKRERQLQSEKEAIAGSDGISMKQEIVLPSLKKKWEAEKIKLDLDRAAILESTPKATASLGLMREETRKIVDAIKSKPATSFNNILLVKNEERLKTIDDIIAMVDKSRK